MTKIHLLFFSLILTLSMSCKNEEKQFEEDLDAIMDYIAAHNLDAQSTASGLHYVVVNEGAGTMKPDLASQVSVRYRGEYLDGIIFEKRDDPVTLAVNNVIEGWREGLQLMTVGAKYQFLIPSRLAYGEDGTGPIGPNTPLFFEIELLGFTNEEIIFQEQLVAIEAYANSNDYDYDVTASGLHYVIVEPGVGTEMPNANSEVTTTYRGEFLTGEVFDESTAEIQFNLSNVIAGWTEGLQLMKKGSIYYFIIPSRLAYGQQGQNSIPGNTPLFFEVKLIDF